MIVQYPVIDRTISQPFGFDNINNPYRGSFYTLFDNKHPGVDFPVPENTEIYASFEGVVVRKEFHKGMGNVIGVRNGNIVALYAHLNASSVHLGDIVLVGSLIGLSGNTGAASLSPHLHFELRDITKPSLREMMFAPKFEETPNNYRYTFDYVVNNKNTKKTLKSLSRLYFGIDDKWNLILDMNSFDFDEEKILVDGEKVTIPNFR